MKKTKKDIAVIGLGTFGYELAVALNNAGINILAVDKKMEIVNRIKDKVSIAVQADITEVDIIKKLDLAKFDKVILGMSNSLENLILAITHLKKLNTKYIIAKANTHLQKEILLKIGADEVIQPEVAMAHSYVKKIAYPNILESIIVDPVNSFVELIVPKKIEGRTLKELNLREKYGVLVFMKKDKEKYNIITNPNQSFIEGDIIFVAGEEEKILKIFKN